MSSNWQFPLLFVLTWSEITWGNPASQMHPHDGSLHNFPAVYLHPNTATPTSNPRNLCICKKLSYAHWSKHRGEGWRFPPALIKGKSCFWSEHFLWDLLYIPQPQPPGWQQERKTPYDPPIVHSLEKLLFWSTIPKIPPKRTLFFLKWNYPPPILLLLLLLDNVY